MCDQILRQQAGSFGSAGLAPPLATQVTRVALQTPDALRSLSSPNQMRAFQPKPSFTSFIESLMWHIRCNFLTDYIYSFALLLQEGNLASPRINCIFLFNIIFVERLRNF